MTIRTTLALTAAALLAACAQSPSSIQAVSMGNAFASLSCNEAATMLNAENQTLADLTQQQNAAVAGDAIGVLFILVPVSSLTGGDVAGEIAASKGKQLALQARLAGC